MPNREQYMIVLPDYQQYTPELRDKIKRAIEKRHSSFEASIRGQSMRFNIWRLMADMELQPVEIEAAPMPSTGGKK